MAKVLQQQQRSVASGSPEERQYLDKLTQDIMNMNVDFVDFVSRARANKEYVTQRQDSINNDYNQRLMMMITMPLRRGCNKDSILQSIGVAAGAMLFNKEFRKSCSATVQNVMYPYVSAIADRSKPGGFWDTQRRKLSVAEKGRLPLTPESASVMHLGFCRNAYDRMRAPGADRDQVLKDYKDAVQALHAQAREDGISQDVLNQSIRTIAGQLIERDPRLAVCFEELSTRGVQRGAGQVENMVETWRGEYLDASGKAFTGAFNPRIPRTQAEYGRMFSKFFTEQFDGCQTPEALADRMRSPEHKQVRDRYMDLMMQDGMSIEQVHEYVTGYMKQGVTDWCNKNGIKTKDGQQKGPQPKGKPGQQSKPNQQPNQRPGTKASGPQPKPTPGPGKKQDAESRPKPKPEPKPLTEDEKAIKAASNRLRGSMDKMLANCKSMDDVFDKLVSKDAVELLQAYDAETAGFGTTDDEPTISGRKTSANADRAVRANDAIRRAMDSKAKSNATYLDAWDGSSELTAVAKVDITRAKLGSRTYEEPNQAFFDRLDKATEHLAVVPELRQSVIMHACRCNMVAFYDNMAKDCHTKKEFGDMDPEGKRFVKEAQKYDAYFKSLGMTDQAREKAVTMSFDRARDESTAGWCKANHVPFHFERRFNGTSYVALGKKGEYTIDQELVDAFKYNGRHVGKQNDGAEFGG